MLYNLLKKNINSKDRANMLIDSVLVSKKRINEKQLNSEKYNLIKDIKENFNIDELFKTRIREYKVLASIYKIFEATTSNKNYNPTSVVNSRFVILEGMTNSRINTSKNSNQFISDYKKQDKEIKLLSYKMLIESFNKKYEKLDVNQRKLIKKYIDNMSNTNLLKEYIHEQIILTKKIFNKFNCDSNGVCERILKIKLNEISTHLPKLTKGSVIKESQLITMLKIYELIRELKGIR